MNFEQNLLKALVRLCEAVESLGGDVEDLTYEVREAVSELNSARTESGGKPSPHPFVETTE